MSASEPGNEDVDFGLKMLAIGAKMKMLDLEVKHKESQSVGRFKYCEENEKLIYSLWSQETLREIYIIVIMRILVACQTMTSISGSPMYNFTLALELHRRGHSVAVYSMFEDNELQSELVKRKIMTCYSVPSGRFDLALISQPDNASLVEEIAADKIINIVHSEYDCESPIISKKIDHYVAIRKSIKDHLISEHNIPEDNISIIYNGIDFNRFSKKKRKANDEDYIKVVIPCTLDLLRKKLY